MDGNESLVVRPREYSNIACLQDPTVLEEFLDEPLTFVAETITGAFAIGKTGVFVTGGGIFQALLKGKLFQQWDREYHALREAGKIPDDFADSRYAFQTWVDLMRIIDEDSPGPDLLEAFESMLCAVNKVNAEDKDRVRAYQLWQITEQLNSGDLLLLKTLCEHSHHFGKIAYQQWISQVANLSGSGVIELVQLQVERLLKYRLRYEAMSDQVQKAAQITSLGHQLCGNINTYRVDLGNAAAAKDSA
jgi:hypothetical protein